MDPAPASPSLPPGGPAQQADSFCGPSLDERQWTHDLVGRRVTIFWDGDNVFYPALVTKYDEQKDKFLVLYENDDSGVQYVENLRNMTWKICRLTPCVPPHLIPVTVNVVDSSVLESDPDAIAAPAALMDEDATVLDASKLAAARNSNKAPSYAVMIVEAVIALNDKNGSSLNAIRKYILTNYNIGHKQAASFNSLTLKAVNKSVAAGELEKVKHSFRLSPDERDRRKEMERRALGAAAAAFEMRANGLGMRRRTGAFTVDDFLSAVPTVSGRNKALRKELLESRMKRDIFLRRRLSLLKPFLPEKDYFSRKDREEADRRAVMEAKRILGNKSVTLADVSMEEYDEVPPMPTNIVDITATEATDGAAEEAKISSNIIDDSIALVSTLTDVSIVSVPTTLTATLHEHQVVGISWMVHMFNCGMPMILGDQMGLGKTIQTIGFLAYLHQHLNKKGPHLVVVPLSVLSNWLSEIERFCPSFRAVRFHGPKPERDRIKSEELNDLSEFDIVVTTYEILVSEANYFRHKFVWTSIIIDEGHRLKNEKSQLSEKIRCIPCLSKVILTGTPLQNNLHELWSMLFYLAPDIFSSSEPFDEGFDLLRGVIDNEVLRKARKLLAVFMLRRLKESVAIKLPSRKEVTLLVPLTEQQSDLYRTVLCGLDSSTIEVVMNTKDAAPKPVSRVPSIASLAGAETALVEEAEVMDSNENNSEVVAASDAATTCNSGSTMNDSDWRKLMNLLLQLRKTCNHTYLLPNIAPDPYEVTEDIVKGSGKLMMLDRMLPVLRADGHRCLIFSQFTSMLDILEDYCELREYPYVRLDGETNRVKRRLDVRRYNSANSNLFIFLISTRAGGLGLNLASADTVILYDSDWNPQVDLQAMERAHRIGQTKPVRVFRLVCRGSVEERMVSRAEKKLFLNAMVAEMDPDEEMDEEGAETNILQALGIGGTGMSKSELASLIRFGANAVFDSDNAGDGQLSDEDLSKLLERQGRDVPHHSDLVPIAAAVAGAAATSDAPSEGVTQEDTFEKAQQVLRDRVEKLTEVDLRQLGSVVYSKKKPDRKSMNTFDNSDIIMDGTKRLRKERIVKVDGKGTGYGGAVPILAENMEVEKEDKGDEEKVRTRGRQWVHRSFCTLCGKHVKPEHLCKCAHCPFIFHTSCAEAVFLIGRGSGMFICPHHRCGSCSRSTASAGGLLFRCAGCLSSYCEDCLPQEQIDSLGRCRALEAYNYHSKQAYYIKCPSCCATEGCMPMGVLADPHAPQPVVKGEEEEGDGAAGEVEEGAGEAEPAEGTDDWVELPTMAMRLHWHAVPEPPPKKAKDKKPKGKKVKRGGKRTSKAKLEEEEEEEEGNGSEDEEGDDAEDAGPAKKRKKIIHVTQDDLSSVEVPDDCSLAAGLNLILEHDALRILCSIVEESPLDANEDFVSVIGKVESGRYRSTAQFASDIKYAVEGRSVKRALTLVKNCDDAAELKDKIGQCTALLLAFVNDQLLPKLSLTA